MTMLGAPCGARSGRITGERASRASSAGGDFTGACGIGSTARLSIGGLRPRSGDCAECCKKGAPRGRQQQLASVHFDLQKVGEEYSRPEWQVL